MKIPAAIAKYRDGAIPLPAASPPNDAPAIPPKLNSAWKDDMMARPMRCSRNTACAFIEIFIAPENTPNTTSAPVSHQRLGASGRRTRLAAMSAVEVAAIARLPLRETSAPVTGMEINAPQAAPSSARPSCAGRICKCAWNAGIRESQVETIRPCRKNSRLVPSRARIGFSFPNLPNWNCK